MIQRYVFYNEQDWLTPYLDADEQTWEPKFSALVPTLFMNNFMESLERSVSAFFFSFDMQRSTDIYLDCFLGGCMAASL